MLYSITSTTYNHHTDTTLFKTYNLQTDANIFIGSLIFVQELADKVVEVLEPNRDRLDAVLIFPSMPEVMRLNKVGSFSMANLGQSKVRNT